eukprot:2667773-Amphidinium_carterae.1
MSSALTPELFVRLQRHSNSETISSRTKNTQESRNMGRAEFVETSMRNADGQCHWIENRHA